MFSTYSVGIDPFERAGKIVFGLKMSLSGRIPVPPMITPLKSASRSGLKELLFRPPRMIVFSLLVLILILLNRIGAQGMFASSLRNGNLRKSSLRLISIALPENLNSISWVTARKSRMSFLPSATSFDESISSVLLMFLKAVT